MLCVSLASCGVYNKNKNCTKLKEDEEKRMKVNLSDVTIVLITSLMNSYVNAYNYTNPIQNFERKINLALEPGNFYSKSIYYSIDETNSDNGWLLDDDIQTHQ